MGNIYGFEFYFSSNGTLLNDEYVVGNAIGKGGFGIVYEANSTSHPELKVCKFVNMNVIIIRGSWECPPPNYEY